MAEIDEISATFEQHITTVITGAMQAAQMSMMSRYQQTAGQARQMQTMATNQQGRVDAELAAHNAADQLEAKLTDAADLTASNLSDALADVPESIDDLWGTTTPETKDAISSGKFPTDDPKATFEIADGMDPKSAYGAAYTTELRKAVARDAAAAGVTGDIMAQRYSKAVANQMGAARDGGLLQVLSAVEAYMQADRAANIAGQQMGNGPQQAAQPTQMAPETVAIQPVMAKPPEMSLG